MAIWLTVGDDKCFDDTARLDVAQCIFDIVESVAPSDRGFPREAVAGSPDEVQCALEVDIFDTPAAHHRGVFAVECGVRVYFRNSVVGVLTDHDNPASIAYPFHGSGDRGWVAACLDDDIGAVSAAEPADCVGGRGRGIDGRVDAETPGSFSPGGYGIGASHPVGPLVQRQGAGGQSDGTSAEDENPRRIRQTCLFDGMDRGGKPASCGHPSFRRDRLRQGQKQGARS